MNVLNANLNALQVLFLRTIEKNSTHLELSTSFNCLEDKLLSSKYLMPTNATVNPYEKIPSPCQRFATRNGVKTTVYIFT